MKSSSGAHYLALDHVRALAIFLVFTWHFLHGDDGYPVPFNAAPGFFPLSLLDEGHTGVALFMTLSGYLFAKLLEGKTIVYRLFLWNRVLRLFPLLIVVVIVKGILLANVGADIGVYLHNVWLGVILPTLPNGAWSITAECHFYVLLPLLLTGFRAYRLLPLLVIVGAVALRVFLRDQTGSAQEFAYYTLVGRIDQFVLGITLCRYRHFFTGRHTLVVGGLVAFTAFYWYFDRTGGFFHRPAYPSPSAWWIVLPTIEGGIYALAIA